MKLSFFGKTPLKIRTQKGNIPFTISLPRRPSEGVPGKPPAAAHAIYKEENNGDFDFGFKVRGA